MNMSINIDDFFRKVVLIIRFRGLLPEIAANLMLTRICKLRETVDSLPSINDDD